MRYSRMFIPTLKEDPAEAEVISHRLMVRAGLIRRLALGIYNYLPLGLKILRKFQDIVREELNRAGAQEILMPQVHPAELWKESGRWEKYGKELLRFKDRHDREYCLGPTHEEVVTDIVRREVRSYRHLPINLYQFQQKFRDEIRPRFGVMRSREFEMKDGYSFDADEAGAERSYQAMYQAYNRIFTRCGLKFAAVEADSGQIGGSFSHEFMVLAETGEDAIVFCPGCGYAANTEKAELRLEPEPTFRPEGRNFRKIHTPKAHTVVEVADFLKVRPADIIKTLIYQTENGPLAVLVRGDHEVNEVKLKNLLGGVEPRLAEARLIEELTKAPVGFAGPVGLEIRVLADHAVRAISQAVVGANQADHHLMDVVPEKDFSIGGYFDLRVAQAGDPCHRCGTAVQIKRGIEVGHVFKLGTKYSKAMKATFLDAEGNDKEMIMGCYGIGSWRTLAAAIEQNNDPDGIIWPMALAPFDAAVLPLQVQDPAVAEASEKLYNRLVELGVDVLLDDRDERAGIKFKDADLIGLPIRLAVSKKTLAAGQVELKERGSREVKLLSLDAASQEVKELRDRRLAGL